MEIAESATGTKPADQALREANRVASRPRALLPFVTIMMLAASPAANPQADQSGTSGYARPKVGYDGEVTSLRDVPYQPKFYFQEGKSYGDLDAHVYVEPIIRLQLEENGKLKGFFDDENQILELYFRTDVDRKDLIDSLRSDLIAAAKRAGTEIDQGTLRYRLSILDRPQLSQAWFETAKPRLVNGRYEPLVKSLPYRGGFGVNGEVKIYFPVNDRQSYQNVISLVENKEEILFVYRFEGVKDETCEANVTAKELQQTSLYRNIKGKGGKGAVSREQLADVVDEIVSGLDLHTRCSDLTTAAQLMDKLIRLLDQHEYRTIIDVESWRKVGEFLMLDPASFRADMERKVANLSNKVERDIFSNAFAVSKSQADASSTQEGSSVGGGVSIPGVVGFNAQKAEQLSEELSSAGASAEAKKLYEDVLNKYGVSGSWEGERYIPKSVAVQTDADLQRALDRGIKIKYTITTGGPGGDARIINPKTPFLKSSPAEERLAELEFEGKKRERALNNRLNRIEERVRRLNLDHVAATQRMETFDQTVDEVDRFRKSLQGSMEVRVYRLKASKRANRQRSNDFVATDVSPKAYPIADILSWHYEEACYANYGPMAPNIIRISSSGNEDRWMIRAKELGERCRYLTVVVAYSKLSRLFSGVMWNFAKRRTKGGTFQLLR